MNIDIISILSEDPEVRGISNSVVVPLGQRLSQHGEFFFKNKTVTVDCEGSSLARLLSLRQSCLQENRGLIWVRGGLALVMTSKRPGIKMQM